MFKKVAAVVKLRKKDFKPADKTPYNYDKKPFQLDGKLELDVSFQDRTITTDIYVKMDALEPLLLSKGLCCQLGKVTYHPEVNASQRGRFFLAYKVNSSNAQATAINTVRWLVKLQLTL